MATVGIDGAVSGLDTTSLISQLMQVETAPQTLLKNKQTDANNLITALQSMNTKVSSLADAAKVVTAPSNWASAKSTSSATSVTAATSSTSQVGTVTFTVDKVAQAQTALVTPAALGTGTTFTIKVGDKLTTVTASSNDPRDIANALNNATGSGVIASTVRTSSGSSPTYTLQLSAASTGVDNTFQVFAGTSDDVTAGTATPIAMQEVQAASDAQITLYPGTGSAQTLTSDSNTFTGLMTGTDVTVSKVETDPVTVSIARDPSKIASNVSSMFGALSVVFSEITSRTASTTTTNSDGSTSVTGGLFSGDSNILSLQIALSSAASSPVGGTHSPSEMGVSVDKDGNFTFDQSAFTAAYNANPAQVQSWMNELVGRVQKAATTASDPISGTITQEITGENSIVKNLSDQISNWDSILAMKQASLQSMFTNMETRLSTLQSQQSYLTSQLSSLPSWG